MPPLCAPGVLLETSQCCPLAPARQRTCVVSGRYVNDGGHGSPVLEIAGTAVERLETSFPLSTRRGSGSPAHAVRQSATGTLLIRFP